MWIVLNYYYLLPKQDLEHAKRTIANNLLGLPLKLQNMGFKNFMVRNKIKKHI